MSTLDGSVVVIEDDAVGADARLGEVMFSVRDILEPALSMEESRFSSALRLAAFFRGGKSSSFEIKDFGDARIVLSRKYGSNESGSLESAMTSSRNAFESILASVVFFFSAPVT